MVAQARHLPSRNAMRLLLLLAVALTFGRILSNEFVDWDDGTLIYDNPNITQGKLEGLARQWNWRDPNTFHLYDPLVYTTWWMLAHAGRIQTPDALGATINPQVFHAANLIVHWLAGCVVLEILARIGLGGWPGFLGAMLFVVHPLQTEAVAWATGMKDLLGGLFALTTIWRYLVAGQLDGAARRNNLILATLLCMAAYLAKPSTVVLPLIAICFDLILFHRPLRRNLPWLGIWLAMSGVITAINASIQPYDTRLKTWPIWCRPLIAGDALNFYLCKLLLPIHLTFDYGRTPLAMLNDPHHALYWAWIFPVIVALFVWWLRRPMLTAAALIFFLGVLPVLGFILFAYQAYSTVADRYIYLSMLGVAIAAAWVLSRHGNRIVWFAAGGVLGAMISLSFIQAGIWKNTDTLYAQAISLDPGDGAHYMIVAEYEEKEAELALRRTSFALQHGDADGARADHDDALRLMRKAVEFRRREIEFDPEDAEGNQMLPADLKFLDNAEETPR